MGEKWIVGTAEERKPWSWGKTRERGTYRGLHKENTFPKSLAGKTRWADICQFLQPIELKDLF